MLDEYKRFIMRGNALDLAVGVVAGAAFGTVVSSLVSDVITPLIAAVFGQPDFSNLSFSLRSSDVHYGSFLNAVLSFFLTMTGVFVLVVKPMSIATEHLLPPGEERLRECPECLSDIPVAARRCAHCCVELAPTV